MEESPRRLVTSALEECWPTDEPILFMGHWCLRYSRRSTWEALDYEVFTGSGKARSEIPVDIAYIQEVCERFLPEIAATLNRLHGVNHSLRYWRIVLGWWLVYFAQVFFDRWQFLQMIAKSQPNIRLARLSHGGASPSSNDCSAFIEALSNDDWDERLCGEIAATIPGIEVVWLNEEASRVRNLRVARAQVRARLSRRRRVFLLLLPVLDWASKVEFLSNRRVALYATYMRPAQHLRLSLLLGSLPIPRAHRPMPAFAVDGELRRWIPPHGWDNFSRALAEFLPRYLPRSYLEGYAESSALAEKGAFPRRPKVIMTANAFSGDDLWAFWAAAQVEMGARLVIAQHGGHYGAGAWSTTLIHEAAISDRYLTWGWSDASEPKMQRAPASKLLGLHRRKRARQSGTCLQVVSPFVRLGAKKMSIPVGDEIVGYFGDQLRFAQCLRKNVQSDLLVRLPREDYGWDLAARWHDGCPGIKLDLGTKAMGSLLDGTKLYVATYNATTFLESFTMGIPTVLFWNPEHWNLRPDAETSFRRLRLAGVLYDSPEMAAHHVNSIWSEVSYWWSKSDVQNAVVDFCNDFAYRGERPIREMATALTSWESQNRGA